MRIKRYEAEERDLPRIIRQIRRDLGENAVVKTRRYKKGGVLGLGGKAMVEVYAGVERELPGAPGAAGSDPNSKSRQALLEQLIQASSGNFNGNLAPSQASNNQPPVIYQPPGTAPIVSPSSQSCVATVPSSKLEIEIQKLANEIADIRRTLEETKLEQGKSGQTKVESQKYPRWLGHLREKLLQNEVDERTAEAMLDETVNSSDATALSDFEGALTSFQRTVTTSIEARGCIKGQQNPRILALAGPTGVGKTTTLAKLAATANLLDKQRVGLISADTYRIAAIDQLKTFAGILDIPLKVVFSPAELREALREYASMDRILIDTAGRSPNNDERMEELRELINSQEDVECHLVLSATTRFIDMVHICDRFRLSRFSRFVFTKLDETITLGPVLAIMYKEGLPASYLTNGQNVPDDIVLAEEKDLLDLIIKRSLG